MNTYLWLTGKQYISPAVDECIGCIKPVVAQNILLYPKYDIWVLLLNGGKL